MSLFGEMIVDANCKACTKDFCDTNCTTYIHRELLEKKANKKHSKKIAKAEARKALSETMRTSIVLDMLSEMNKMNRRKK